MTYPACVCFLHIFFCLSLVLGSVHLSLYGLNSARTRLSADGKSASKGGQRQFNGLIDVYKQTLKTDGVMGLYRGFVPSVVGICVYRGL